MGAKRFDNVDDCCRNGADLIISCGHCGHRVQINPWRLMMRFDAELIPRKRPPNGNYGTVSQRLKCGRCGARHPDVRPTARTR